MKFNINIFLSVRHKIQHNIKYKYTWSSHTENPTTFRLEMVSLEKGNFNFRRSLSPKVCVKTKQVFSLNC